MTDVEKKKSSNVGLFWPLPLLAKDSLEVSGAKVSIGYNNEGERSFPSTNNVVWNGGQLGNSQRSVGGKEGS